ncbi:MAG: hypothetical protein J6P74_03595 [Paludibacteraceae bacterium]|nr:hypothetical protein [Paludibacteraceae bacterium]
MKRTELAFQAGLPQENKRRKIIVVTIGVLVLSGWALLALYSIVGGRKNNLSFAPEMVYVPQAPAPAVGSGPSFYQSPRRGSLMYKPSAVSYQHSTTNYTPAPKAAMGSTSFRVHQTSSAAVHSYGGGGTGGGNAGAIIHRSSGSGVNYAALSYSGAIYVPTKRNAVTAVGANEASDFSAQKMSVIRRRAKADADPGEGEYPGVPEDPAPDPEPPVPVGDMPIVMLVLIVAAYALRITRRRKAELAE